MRARNLCLVPQSERKGAQSCPTLQDPMDYTVHGILQARILQWVASPFSRDLPNPGIEPRSPALQADSLPGEPQGKPLLPKVSSNSAADFSPKPESLMLLTLGLVPPFPLGVKDALPEPGARALLTLLKCFTSSGTITCPYRH